MTANSISARLLSGRMYFAKRGAQALLESFNFDFRLATVLVVSRYAESSFRVTQTASLNDSSFLKNAKNGALCDGMLQVDWTSSAMALWIDVRGEKPRSLDK